MKIMEHLMIWLLGVTSFIPIVIILGSIVVFFDSIIVNSFAIIIVGYLNGKFILFLVAQNKAGYDE